MPGTVLFGSVALATRIDRAEMRLTESMVRVVEQSRPAAKAFLEAIGGGVAAYAGPSSPMNKLIGAGFAGAPSDAELAAVEARFREQDAPLQVEVATLAQPAFAALLTKRGYVLQGFENVSGRAIDGADRALPDDVDIRVDRATESTVAAWTDAAITGFQHPDGQGVPAEELPPREVLEEVLRPWASVRGMQRYQAWIGGQLAGVASLRMDDGIAQLCGATTLPAFRRRGVQSALLRHRLADAASAGCELAVITTQPGSTSQENASRQGFLLLYARALLVKSPALLDETETTPARTSTP